MRRPRNGPILARVIFSLPNSPMLYFCPCWKGMLLSRLGVSWVQIPRLMSAVAMLSVMPSSQWVVLNDSWCYRIVQLNEERLVASRSGVASIESRLPAQCVPPWVAVGSWMLYSRLGYVREPTKGDPAKKVGRGEIGTFARKFSPCNAAMGW